MKIKRINAARFAAIENFLSFGWVKSDVILAGGALRTLIDPKDEVMDYDLFFIGDYDNVLCNMNAIEDDIMFDLFGAKVFQCPEDQLRTFLVDDFKVQLINIGTYKDAEDIIDDFDINACRFAYDGEFLYTDRKAISDVKNKVVSYNTIQYPIATFRRTAKYKNKGYNINNAAREFCEFVINNPESIDLDTVYID